MAKVDSLHTPIKRLCNVLTIMKNQNITIAEHLAIIQGDKAKAGDPIFRNIAYGELSQLVRDARDQILSYENADERLHIGPIKRVENVIGNLGPTASVQDFFSNIGNDTILSLEHCVHLFQNADDEKLIPTDELANLLEAVNDLIEEVAHAEIPQYLKELLSEQLYGIHKAITAYRISGARGIKRALDQSLGALIFNQERIRHEAGEDKENNSWRLVKKFSAFLLEGNKIVSLAFNVQKIYQLVHDIWGSGQLPGH